VTARLATAAAIAIGLAAAEGSSNQPPLFELRRSAEASANAEELPSISQAAAQHDISQAVGQSFSSAQGTSRGLPDGAGVEVARSKCLGCHEADIIVSQRLSPTGWDREVAKMERWGAKLSAEERPVLVGYLTRQFGVRPMALHDATAVAAGEAVYTAACRTCHDDDLSEQQRLTAAAWGRTVDKMVRWGAKVSAGDKPALVAYLTSRWGHP
jgi:cytochrome c5